MRSPLRPVLTAAALAISLVAARSAHAEPTAWAAVGGGALGWKQGDSPDFRTSGSLMVEAGAGIPNRFPVIVGGLFRVTPLLAAGTGADMAWLARVATRGYQVGGFGIAADIGAYARFWGTHSTGFAGSLSVGAPLGLALSFHAMAGNGDLLAFGGTLTVDLLRLTLSRQTLLNWWPNPEVQTKTLPTAKARSVGLHF